jgi:hypothetical protein
VVTDFVLLVDDVDVLLVRGNAVWLLVIVWNAVTDDVYVLEVDNDSEALSVDVIVVENVFFDVKNYV